MLPVAARFLLLVVASGAVPVHVFAQGTAGGPPSLARVEPGLEKAVKWKWWVAPSDARDWGLELPVFAPVAPAPAPAPGFPNPSIRSGIYEVQRGDTLTRIGRKFGATAQQLKDYNGMTSDMIRIGQEIKIPSPEELSAMTPPPLAKKEAPAPKPLPGAAGAADTVLLEVFLDRQQFSTGPIDGTPDALFQRVLRLYQDAHPEAGDAAAILEKARTAMGDGFTRYALKTEDFRFIAPPRAEKPEPLASSSPATARSAKNKPAPSAPPPPAYEELTGVSMLAYRTPWEFVAERFHCNEAFLRSLNPGLGSTPLAGAEFRVPNVVPFEIENAFRGLLQPPPDPQSQISAAVLDLSLLAIHRNGALMAVMPLSIARPGLRGRDSWTVLDAIPRPRLATKQELRIPPRPVVYPYGARNADPTPVPTPPVLESEQYLAAGPRNPVGIIWIDLAKAGETDPLPYGLSGTSLPDDMQTHESIGGLRLANWDILRAARLLPPGTPLQWTTGVPVPAPKGTTNSH